MASDIASYSQRPARGSGGFENMDEEPKDVSMTKSKRTKMSHTEFSSIPVTLNYRLVPNYSKDTRQETFQIARKQNHRVRHRVLTSRFAVALESSFSPSTDTLTASGEVVVPSRLDRLFLKVGETFELLSRLELGLCIIASLQSGDFVEFFATPRGGNPIIDDALLQKLGVSSGIIDEEQNFRLPFSFTLELQKASAKYGLFLALGANFDVKVALIAKDVHGVEYPIYYDTATTTWYDDLVFNNQKQTHGGSVERIDNAPVSSEILLAGPSSKRNSDDDTEQGRSKRRKMAENEEQSFKDTFSTSERRQTEFYNVNTETISDDHLQYMEHSLPPYSINDQVVYSPVTTWENALPNVTNSHIDLNQYKAGASPDHNAPTRPTSAFAREEYDRGVQEYIKTDQYKEYLQYPEGYRETIPVESLDLEHVYDADPEEISTTVSNDHAVAQNPHTTSNDAKLRQIAETHQSVDQGIKGVESVEEVLEILQEPELGAFRSRSASGSVATKLKNLIRKLHRRAPLVSHHRLEWTCGCGETLYADINKRSEGEIERLAAILQCSPTFSHGSSNVALGNVQLQRPPPVVTPYRSSSSPSSSSQGSSSSTLISPISSTYSISTPDLPKQSYLELCINTGEYTKTLSEIDLANVGCDGELFRRIRSEYLRLRSFRSKIWLLKPSGVHFVKFTVQNGHRVGILQTPLSIPPQREVSAKNWAYTPCPLEDDPPMPQDIFLHYLSCTEFDPSPAWLPRLPKKLDLSILRFTGAINEGWGIHIKEGPNWAVLGWVNLGVMVMSGVAAGLWKLYMGDFQGAFGFAGWIVAVVNAVLVAWIAKWSQL